MCLALATLIFLTNACAVIFEPTSVAKSTLPFVGRKPPGAACFPAAALHLAAPNTLELDAMYEAADAAALFDYRIEWFNIIDSLLIEGISTSTMKVKATVRYFRSTNRSARPYAPSPVFRKANCKPSMVLPAAAKRRCCGR